MNIAQRTAPTPLADEPAPAGTEQLDDLAQYCRDLFFEYSGSSYRKKKLEDTAEGRKRYDGDFPGKAFPWAGCSNKSMQLEAITVDNLEPRLKAQLISDEEFIQAAPVGEEDAANAQAVKKFMLWALRNNMKLNDHIMPICHDLLLDGTVDLIPIWEEKERTTRIRTTRQILTGPGGQQIPAEQIPPQMVQQLAMMGFQEQAVDGFEERPQTDFKVRLEVVPLTSAYFPDTWENWDEMPYLRMIYPTLDELKQLSDENGGPYFGIDDALVQNPETREQTDDDKSRQGIKHSEYTKEVEICECYVKWQEQWMIVSFANKAGWREVRRQPVQDVYWHGRKPVHRLRLFPDSKGSMGTGIPRKITHLSTGIDDLYNQMVDNGTIQNMPFGFLKTGASWTALDLGMSPGKLTPIPRDSDIIWPNWPGQGERFIAFINVLLGFFERLISLSDYHLGGESKTAGKGGETFSGMSLIVQEGNIKHQYTGEGLRGGFNRILTDVYSLYAQNMPSNAKRRVFENEQWVFEPIDTAAIQGNFDIMLQISDASANKMLNRREKVELYQMLGKNPTADMNKATEELLRAYGIREPKEWLNQALMMLVQALQQAPELPQVIQAYMQKKQQDQRDAQIQGEAEANVRRQAIERDVEAPVEDAKLMNQVTEGAKRKLITPMVEESIGRDVMAAISGGGV